MTIDLIKFAFVAGEVSPSYYGRADLEKFDLALAEAENWFVDYHGGLSNVPGTLFVDHIQFDESPVKAFAFQFSSLVQDKYLIILGNGYIRFVQDGAYVLEAAKTVTALSLGAQTSATIAAHGFTDGEWVQVVSTGETVELVNRTCQVEVNSANSITLRDTLGNHIDSSSYTAYSTGMTIARIYTLVNPFAVEDISAVRAGQIRDVVRLTHPDYETQNLRRFDNASWTIQEESFVNTVTVPSITSTYGTGTASGYAAGYVVTAVDVNGRESLPSDYAFITDMGDILNVSSVTHTIKFSEVPGADYYNVYRTRVSHTMGSSTYNISRAFQLGYIGRSKGASFTDTGITPDFTITPPTNSNPFAKGAIRYVDVLSSGNFSRNITMTVTDSTGSGFIGYPIVHINNNSNSGPVVGILILDGGENYTNPTITLSSGGTFTYDIELSDSSGLDPAVSAVYQQRQIYAGSDNNPLVVYGSKPGNLSDFTVSSVLVPSDSFQHEIDSENYAAIRHLVPTRGGLLVMSAGGIWLMSGSEGRAITALDVQADLNVFTGASDVPPLKIDTDIIYTTATGGRVNTLAYADQYKLYAPTDVSILANHLITNSKISRWTYADEPHRLIHAVRDDGVLLLFTMIKDQDVYAWTRRITKGQYLDVVGFDGEGETDVYYIVERKLNGRYRKVIERLATRVFETKEDPVFLDCALKLAKTYPAANIEIEAATGVGVIVRASAAVFTSTDVDKILRFGKGKARVKTFVNSTTITIDVILAFDQLLHYTVIPRRAMSGEWTLDAEVSSVSGLYHLDGETVSIVADGNVTRNVVVSNGTVTLPQPASRVVVGIPYKSVAKNLPLNVPGEVTEKKVKRIPSLALRVLDTKGIKVGTRTTELYSPRTALAEVLGDAGPLYTGITHFMVEPVWSDEGQNYFVQEDPFPATILGYVLGADFGDG